MTPATFYAVRGGNDLYWRCEAPARELKARQEIIQEKNLYDTVMYPHMRGACRWWLEVEHLDGRKITLRNKRRYDCWLKENRNWRSNVLQTQAVFPDHQGTAVWIRPCVPRAALAESMRYQYDIRTVSEVDDFYLTPPKHSLALRSSGWSDEESDDHLQAICSMNALVFSTDRLRDMYWRHIKKKYKAAAKLLELYVCRNHVVAADWPERVEQDGPVRVGWMGSPSHVWDVDLAWPALLHASNLGAETWMIGYNPVDDPLQTAAGHEKIGVPLHPRASYKIDQWRKVKFRHVPWAMPEKYKRLALPLDIGLCPLLTNQMTLGKSDVKFVEYTISGAATIAWNNSVYNNTIVHGETGLLVGSPQEMLQATELLINDEGLRRRLVENAQQYVRENRNETHMTQEWTAAING